jgi:hypothetical protein
MWKNPQVLTQATTTLNRNLAFLLNLIKQLFMVTWGTQVKTWEPDLHMSQMEQDIPY